jgi:Ni/Co efflux regulator RcnB
VSKLDVGFSSGKLNEPPKSCIPNKAKMKMKRKRRKSKDMMDDKAFMRAITRLRKGDQYLKRERGQTDNQSDLAGYALYSLVLPSSLGST